MKAKQYKPLNYDCYEFELKLPVGSSSCEWGVGECLPVPVPPVPAGFHGFKIKSTALHHNLFICSIFTQVFMNIKVYLYVLVAQISKNIMSEPI